MGVRFTGRARKLLDEIRKDYSRLHLLMDDTGCCGPGHVFLQPQTPSTEYVPFGGFGNIQIHVHPAFRRSAREEEFLIDARSTEADDSFSIETARDYRFTLTLLEGAAADARREGRAGPRDPLR